STLAGVSMGEIRHENGAAEPEPPRRARMSRKAALLLAALLLVVTGTVIGLVLLGGPAAGAGGGCRGRRHPPGIARAEQVRQALGQERARKLVPQSPQPGVNYEMRHQNAEVGTENQTHRGGTVVQVRCDVEPEAAQ